MSTELITLRALISLGAVLALLGLCLWALRRGGGWQRGGASRAITVETAASLGDRRSLAIVRVEGRRLLIGLTPGSVALIADLASQSSATGSDAAP